MSSPGPIQVRVPGQVPEIKDCPGISRTDGHLKLCITGYAIAVVSEILADSG